MVLGFLGIFSLAAGGAALLMSTYDPLDAAVRMLAMLVGFGLIPIAAGHIYKGLFQDLHNKTGDATE